MNDTYAVVNKHKQPPPTSPAPSPTQAPPTTTEENRAPPPSQLYGNEPTGAMAMPLYSKVQPRVKPISVVPSITTIYDKIAVTNQQLGAEPEDHTGYELVTDVCRPSPVDHYEFVSSPTAPLPTAGIGFNSRIKKPRGPRAPPAEWSCLER